MLLIQTLFSVLFHIRRKVILSILCDYVCRANRFRVMVNFVIGPNKFQILLITVSCVLLAGDYLSVKPATCKRYSLLQTETKDQSFY